MAISESQKGRVIEQLVGATLILQSNGALRFKGALKEIPCAERIGPN
jgi:hypothetical protein